MWQKQIATHARKVEVGLRFLSKEHHLIRNFAVTQLPRDGRPLSPERIAQKLSLPVSRVNLVLEDLEKRRFFLFRNEAGKVAWAYPVTADSTPHQVSFSTGEQIYAA
jgi:hypothetical protein